MKTDNVWETEYAQSILVGLQYHANKHGLFYGKEYDVPNDAARDNLAKRLANKKVQRKAARHQRNLNRRNTGRP